MDELQDFVWFARRAVQEMPIFEKGYPRFDWELAVTSLMLKNSSEFNEKGLKEKYINFLLKEIKAKSPQQFFGELSELKEDFMRSKEAALLVEIVSIEEDIKNEFVRDVILQMLENIATSAIFFMLLLKEFFKSLEQPNFYNSKGIIQ